MFLVQSAFHDKMLFIQNGLIQANKYFAIGYGFDADFEKSYSNFTIQIRKYLRNYWVLFTISEKYFTNKKTHTHNPPNHTHNSWHWEFYGK